MALLNNYKKNMSNILSSASKIVFILVTIALVVGMFVGKISGEQFIGLATMTFAFYFGTRAKGDAQTTTTTSDPTPTDTTPTQG